jgi:hypothetical protein
MANDLFGYFIVILVAATAIVVLVSRDWRVAIAGMGLQYLLAFLLIIPSWPLELAAVKLVTGWISISILGVTRLNLEEEVRAQKSSVPTGRAFQILTSLLILLVVAGAAPRLAGWTSAIGINQAWGGLLLIGMGLIQLGLRPGFFRSSLGLLTLFSGFEILYAAVEASTLVAGLLAVVNLGIALAGSYLLQAPVLEPQE